MEEGVPHANGNPCHTKDQVLEGKESRACLWWMQIISAAPLRTWYCMAGRLREVAVPLLDDELLALLLRQHRHRRWGG